jgi:hypothetical protein
MMRSFQSFVERSLYILLMLVLIANTALSVWLFIIIQNEKSVLITDDHYRKKYIACLLSIDTSKPVKPQEQACYNAAP